jgi:hypothetical protein
MWQISSYPGLFRGTTRAPLLVPILSTLLVSCTSLASLPSSSTLPVGTVVDKVECDLHTAVKAEILNGHSYLDDWAAAFTLTLKVEEQGGLAIVPVTAVTFPFSSVSHMFNLNFGAGTTETSRRTATLNFSFKLHDALHDARLYVCPPQFLGDHPLVAGDLGISEWLHRSLTAIDGNDLFKEPTSIGHTTEFEIIANGALGPSVVLSRFTGTGSLTAQRTDTDTLDLALAAIPPEPDRQELLLSVQKYRPKKSGRPPSSSVH